MSTLLVLALMWAVTFVPRWLGLGLRRTLPLFWLDVLRYVPVSVFAALVVPDVLGSPEWPRRLLGAVVCAALIWRTRNLGLGLLGGFAAYWLVRALGL